MPQISRHGALCTHEKTKAEIHFAFTPQLYANSARYYDYKPESVTPDFSQEDPVHWMIYAFCTSGCKNNWLQPDQNKNKFLPITGTEHYSLESRWPQWLSKCDCSFEDFTSLVIKFTKSGITHRELKILSKEDSTRREEHRSEKFRALFKYFQSRLIESNYINELPKPDEAIKWIRAIRKGEEFIIVLENPDGTWPKFDHLDYGGCVLWFGKNHEAFMSTNGNWPKTIEFFYSYPAISFQLQKVQEREHELFKETYMNSYIGYLYDLRYN